MVAASVAPPTFDQRRHSAYNCGILSKMLVKLMTKEIFGLLTQFERATLEDSTFGQSLYFRAASEEMIMNDRSTTRNVGGQETAFVRVTQTISDRIDSGSVCLRN